jgi:hypothetical protein
MCPTDCYLLIERNAAIGLRITVRIGDGRGFNELSARNKSTVNEQIVEILIHSSTKNFQPELLPNSEQKADEMHVSPAIANANVVCSCIIVPQV